MEPVLLSVCLGLINDNSSIVEIVYGAPPELSGIELMGVDAGLSWLKGKSIMLAKSAKGSDIIFSANIEITDTCEFRARGFAGEDDHWEDGLGNHRLIRQEDGSLQFESELGTSQYTFKGGLPIQYSSPLEVVIERVENIPDNANLFQLLVDISIWTDTLLEDPQNENKIYPIAKILVFLKERTRQRDSQKIDNVVRPVINALYQMQRTALDFVEDDSRLLVGEWEREGYVDLLKNLGTSVKELDAMTDLGRGRDSFERFRELLKFVS